MERKILAAIDGSDQAMDAVRYIGRMFPVGNTEVVLLNIFIEVPESFLDLSMEPAFRSRITSISMWSNQMRINIENSMSEAKKILKDAGFPSKSVKTKIQTKNIGIARDILKESRKGYSLVVAGRTGLSHIKDVIMGNISTKLIGRIPEIPVAIISGDPDAKKILIGFDGSAGAMKAVRCIGRLTVDTDCKITLCYVIRPMGFYHGIAKYFNPEEEESWIAENRELIEPAFALAENSLKNEGFSSGRISREILRKKTSRAAAISHKAEEGYGTVVIGRRGLTAVEEFVMGRVSTKVLNMVTKSAVWIV